MKVEVIQDLLEHLTIPGTRVVIITRDSPYAQYIAQRLGLRKNDWSNKDRTIQVRVVRDKHCIWAMSGMCFTRAYMVDNTNPFVDTTHLEVENFVKSRMRSTEYRGPFEIVRFQMSYKD